MKDFQCTLSKVDSVEDWLRRGDKDGNCPSCLLAPLASYYVGVLEDHGEKGKARELQEAFEQGNGLTIAQTMDKIKKEVGGELLEELKDYDCYAQSFKEDED